MLIFVLEAAIRSLLMASVVWAATRLLRVQAVFAQKVTWVLVLAAAGVMPLLMHAPWLAMSPAVRIPLRSLAPSPASIQPRLNLTQSAIQAVEKTRTVHPISAPRKPKPSAAHRAPDQDGFVVDSRITTGSRALPAPTSPIPDTPERIVSLIESPQTVPIGFLFLRRHLGSIVLGLYLSGVVLLLVRVLVGLAIALRLWHRAEPKSDLASASPSSVRISRDLATPVTIGSTVILPANYCEWEEDKLRIVMAHEQAHVRQADFYLQLLAALYVSVTWFSPLGWWLQRKLSELGEALSDRAGLEQAPNAASYAQVLLEFAAMPRPTVPLAGVAMARSSNLSSRIERILNDSGFRLSFLDGRRHALVAAALVPVALVAVVALIRIEPAVAAQAQATSSTISTTSQSSTQQDSTSSSTVQTSGQMNSAVTGDESVQISGTEPTQSETVIAPVAPQVPPAPPVPERPATAAPEPPEPPAPDVEAPEPPEPPNSGHGFAYSYSDDGQDSFAIIHGKDSTVSMSGHSGEALERARQKVHGDFIWFERNGKSYIITDPAILAQSQAMFQANPELKREQARLKAKQDELNRRMSELNAQNRPRTEAMNRLQAQLGAKQGEIGRQMAQFNRDMAKMQFDSPEMKREMAELNAQIAKSQLNSPEMKREMAEMSAEIAKAQIDSPEMKKQMAELNAKLAELQSDKFKKLTEDLNKKINTEVLSEIQEKMGDIQGQIGEIQGSIGEELGKFGEKQGELGERMGELGEEMGRIGEEQGRKAEEASRKMKSIIDKAFQEGKAKPVDPQ